MDSKQKFFVILTPGFPASEADATCLPMQQDLVLALNKLYPSLHIIILSFQYPYKKNKYQWFGNTVISFSGKNKGGLRRLFLRKQINETLNNLHRVNHICGLLSFWCGECALVGKRFGNRYGIKHYCWILGQDARKANPYPRRISFDAAELIALSDFLQNEFETNHGIRPVAVITPGIESGRLDTSIKQKDIDLLAVGSLISLKQYPIFLEVIAGIKKDLPAVKAIIIGDGPEKESLKKMISKLDLQEQVLTTGELPYNEVLHLMQRTKVFLHPSSYEGFSGVCLEAVSAGTPVISFCKPMNYEIRNWKIAHSAEEMKTMAITILQNPVVDYEPVTEFKIESTAQKMMALFE